METFSDNSDRLYLSQQELLHGCQSKSARMAQEALRDLITVALLYHGKGITEKQRQRITDIRIALNYMENCRRINVDKVLPWIHRIRELLADWESEERTVN